MDYLVFAALRAYGLLPPLVLSYDIVCQWSKHLLERATKLPRDLQIPLPANRHFVIPKYHIKAHKEEGHNQYSLNYMHGAGWTCCEQIERNWPKHEETAASTREMAPGSRHDTLENHFGYANWRVYTNLGACVGV